MGSCPTMQKNTSLRLTVVRSPASFAQLACRRRPPSRPGLAESYGLLQAVIVDRDVRTSCGDHFAARVRSVRYPGGHPPRRDRAGRQSMGHARLGQFRRTLDLHRPSSPVPRRMDGDANGGVDSGPAIPAVAVHPRIVAKPRVAKRAIINAVADAHVAVGDAAAQRELQAD